jgi:hypothetical protein
MNDWPNREDLFSDGVSLLRPNEPLNISHDGYKDALAFKGTCCGICGAEFLAGEVVTAVISGGTVGIKCADVESCH